MVVVMSDNNKAQETIANQRKRIHNLRTSLKGLQRAYDQRSHDYDDLHRRFNIACKQRFELHNEVIRLKEATLFVAPPITKPVATMKVDACTVCGCTDPHYCPGPPTSGPAAYSHQGNMFGGADSVDPNKDAGTADSNSSG